MKIKKCLIALLVLGSFALVSTSSQAIEKKEPPSAKVEKPAQPDVIRVRPIFINNDDLTGDAVRYQGDCNGIVTVNGYWGSGPALKCSGEWVCNEGKVKYTSAGSSEIKCADCTGVLPDKEGVCDCPDETCP